MLIHKTTFNKYTKFEIISCLFWSQCYETGNQSQERNENHTKTWMLNNMLLNNERVNNGVKQETKRHPEMKMKNNPKSMDTAEAV